MRRGFNTLWLAFGYGAFVIYGSLVPLDFHAMPLAEAWQRFQNTPFLELGAESRADWIANGVLYLPLGLLCTRALLPLLVGSTLLAGTFALVGCFMLAFAVEFAQLFFPPRTVSQNDILAEGIGSGLGVLLAACLGDAIRRLWHAWAFRSERIFLVSLQAYALGYLALCFFPYDLLLSAAEYNEKIASGLWGWWLAMSDRGVGLVLIQLVVEVALCVPLGMWWALRQRQHPISLVRPVLLGLLLGLLIELGQFTTVSGISQGASVLTRGIGLGLGAWLAPRLHGLTPDALSATLRRFTVPLLALWLPVLLFVNGWMRVPWQGRNAALATWSDLHLLPFYYHYYTSEAIALFSLGSVALMYLPAALLGWARRWRASRVLLLVLVLVLLVECSKLFLRGQHPDPTNVLIATASCAVLLWMLHRWVLPAAPAQEPAPPVPSVWATGLAAGAPLLLALAMAANFPVAAWPLCLGLIAAAALVVWRPVLAIGIVALALPALDLAPWSGRLYVDEFDLLMLVCIGVAWVRTSGPGRMVWDGGRIAFALVGVALVLATLRALLPWPGLDAGSFSSLASPFVALRIAKGAAWAWLFAALWTRLSSDGQTRAQLFTAGSCAGLIAAVSWLLWERWAFGVLGDFSSDLRATGPFSAMSKGGAYIECYLVVACALVLGALLRDGLRLWLRIALLALLAAGVFGVMLTFSRNGYAGLAAAIVVMALALWRGAGRVRAVWAGAALLGVVAVAVPMALTPFASGRLADSARDLQVRQMHWVDALNIRSPDVLSRIFGEGLGQFPDRHYWRSQEPVHAGSYRVVQEQGQRLLRLGSGATVYIEQILPPVAPQTLQLEARIRSAVGQPKLALSLCEKSILTSRSCNPATLIAPADAKPAAWQQVRTQVDIPTAGVAGRLPLKLSLLTPGEKGSVDVTDIRLTTRDGVPLLRNGSFADGIDHWFFSTDVDPPWHIHNLPLTLLFDQGWFGLAAWATLLGWALTVGFARVDRQGPSAWAPLAALAGFLACGTLNTLVDEPRFLWLLLVLLWLAGRGAFASVRTPQELPADASGPHRAGRSGHQSPVPTGP
jgi:glycopeptide antibiotics resistance protein